MKIMNNPVMVNFKHQETFDLVYRWYIEEENPLSTWAISDNPHYGRLRGDNGAKCPIGLLISDEHYKKEMDGEVMMILDEEDSLGFLTEYNFGFLADLSMAHDASLSWWNQGDASWARKLFEMALIDIALKWQLELPEEDEDKWVDT